MEDFFKQLFVDSDFLYRLLFFVILFMIGSLILLWRQITHLKVIIIQRRKLQSINEKLKGTEQKQEIITQFVDNISDKFIIKTIIEEWQKLQRSLSNFQKYDFDLHISSFLRVYKFNHGNYARNLLLIGLLFTFIYLSNSFLELGSITDEPDADILGFINAILIPDIGLALTSTIAAIVVSFFIAIFGTQLENLIGSLHKELLNFLIIHVHPTFKTANDDTYLNKIQSVLDGLTQNIRESNQNLDAISTQSINTLQRLGEGIGKFTQSADEFKSILTKFSEVQQLTYEHSSEIKLSVDGLNDSVKGISTIFEVEGNIIKEVNQSLTEHRKELSDLVEVMENHEHTSENIEKAIEGLNHEFNNKVIKSLKEKTDRVNSSFENVSRKIIEITNVIDEEVIKGREDGLIQADEFKDSLTQITTEYGRSLREVKESLLQNQLNYAEQTQKILHLQEVLLKKVQDQHDINSGNSSIFKSAKNLFKK
jgi:methyl-accepting chemotaxis protein